MLEEGLEHGHVAVNTTIYCVIQQQQVANWKFIHEPMTTIFCESCKKKKTIIQLQKKDHRWKQYFGFKRTLTVIACLTEHHPSEFPLPSMAEGGYGYFLEQHDGPWNCIIFDICSRLCSKKNWREPIALNLWNLRRPASDFYKKLRFLVTREKKLGITGHWALLEHILVAMRSWGLHNKEPLGLLSGKTVVRWNTKIV